MGKSLAIPTALDQASKKLAEAIGVNPIAGVFERAQTIMAVAEWAEQSEVDEFLKKLEGQPIGFKTDIYRDGKLYDSKTRARCVTAALAHGLRLDGNEFNIISGEMFPTQNAWFRLVEEMGHEDIPGCFSPNAPMRMDWFDVYESAEPVPKGNLVVVPMCIDYRMHNKSTGEEVKGKFQYSCTLTTKSRDTVDAWIGKAMRRILARFFKKFSGQAVSTEEGVDMPDGRSEAEPEKAPLTQGQKPVVGAGAAAEPPKPRAVSPEAVKAAVDGVTGPLDESPPPGMFAPAEPAKDTRAQAPQQAPATQPTTRRRPSINL